MLRITLIPALALLAGLTALSSCRSSASTTNPSPSASAALASAAPRPAPSASAPVVRRAAPGCRVLGASGAAARNADVPAVGRFFGSGDWLELPSDVDLSLRHTETAREFSLRGPGRFQACNAGAESILVARGAVSTSAGPGSRAGAEVLIATPLGAVHFADAKLTLEVTERKFTLRVEQGSVTVETLSAAGKVEAARLVNGPKGNLTLAGKGDPELLVKTCGDAWGVVGSAARTPAALASAGSGLGDWAASQLRARRTARFVCAQARAAVGRLTGADLSRLSGLLNAAEPSSQPVGDAGK